MTTFHDDTHFLASLDPAQRDFIRRRLQPLIDRLQALVGGYPPLSAADPAAVPAVPRRAARAHPPRLTVRGVTYHAHTLPGSGRIRLVRDDGTAVAMWSASEPGAPWVEPGGFRGLHAQRPCRCRAMGPFRHRPATPGAVSSRAAGGAVATAGAGHGGCGRVGGGRRSCRQAAGRERCPDQGDSPCACVRWRSRRGRDRGRAAAPAGAGQLDGPAPAARAAGHPAGSAPASAGSGEGDSRLPAGQ